MRGFRTNSLRDRCRERDNACLLSGGTVMCPGGLREIGSASGRMEVQIELGTGEQQCKQLIHVHWIGFIEQLATLVTSRAYYGTDCWQLIVPARTPTHTHTCNYMAVTL